MSYESDLLAVAPAGEIYPLFSPAWTIGMDRQVMRASGSYWVPREYLQDAMTIIGGTEEEFTLMGAQAVKRIVPLRHPDLPEKMVAASVNAVGAGHNKQGGGKGNYVGYRVTVEWETPNFDMFGEQAFMEVSGNHAERTLPAPASAIQFAGGERPAQDSGLQVNGSDFTVTLHNLSTLDLAKYHNLVNTTNAGYWFGLAPGTVKYLGPRWNRSTALGGVTKWSVGLGFAATSPLFPWNYEIKRDGTPALAYYGGTTTLRYPPADFFELLAA